MTITRGAPVRMIRWLACVVAVAGVSACNDLTGSDSVPAGTVDPSQLRTPEAARSTYRGAIAAFQAAAGGYFRESGSLTDELTMTGTDSVDARILPNDVPTVRNDQYAALHRVRAQAAQAIGALAAFGGADSVNPPALRAEMYALAGFAEVMLAEQYCSGIPLSTVDFDRDYTFAAGSTSEQVYQHAIALFDTAITLGADSAAIQQLARVGKARALLALNQPAQAAATVVGVPDTFQYRFLATEGFGTTAAFTYFNYTVADKKGQTGLAYRTGGDPRTAAEQVGRGSAPARVVVYFPVKYKPQNAPSPHVVASGIEARLIEAEAAYRSGSGTWLTILNALRTTCTEAPCGTPAPAGTGGVAGLAPLTDPGSDSARVTMLFNERAAWLFLTGHRQGDLRRLVRQYGRMQQDVYPSRGTTLTGLAFGDAVTIPITHDQEDANPLFKGCLNRDA